MAAIIEANQPLDPTKRTILVERVAAALRFQQCSGWPSDGDVAAALKSALRGLQHERVA
jgi:hypothetical protein